MVVCEVCRNENFDLHNGYYYCTVCQTQTKELLDLRNEEGEKLFDISTDRDAAASSEIEDKKSIFSHELFTDILSTQLEALTLNLGAPKQLIQVVQNLWTKYLKKCELNLSPEQAGKLGYYCYRAELNYIRRTLNKTATRRRLKYRGLLRSRAKKRSVENDSTTGGSNEDSDLDEQNKVTYGEQLELVKEAFSVEDIGPDMILDTSQTNGSEVVNCSFLDDAPMAESLISEQIASHSEMPDDLADISGLDDLLGVSDELAEESDGKEGGTQSSTSKSTKSRYSFKKSFTTRSSGDTTCGTNSSDEEEYDLTANCVTELIESKCPVSRRFGWITSLDMSKLASILYLGILKCGAGDIILPGDLIRWIHEGHLPYKGPHDVIKCRGISPLRCRIFNGREVWDEEPILRTSSDLARFLNEECLPSVSVLNTISRLTFDLNLPMQIIHTAMCFFHEANLQDLIPDWKAPVESTDSTPIIPSVAAFACALFLVTLKYHFGLSGTLKEMMKSSTNIAGRRSNNGHPEVCEEIVDRVVNDYLSRFVSESTTSVSSSEVNSNSCIDPVSSKTSRNTKKDDESKNRRKRLLKRRELESLRSNRDERKRNETDKVNGSGDDIRMFNYDEWIRQLQARVHFLFSRAYMFLGRDCSSWFQTIYASDLPPPLDNPNCLKGRYVQTRLVVEDMFDLKFPPHAFIPKWKLPGIIGKPFRPLLCQPQLSSCPRPLFGVKFSLPNRCNKKVYKKEKKAIPPSSFPLTNGLDFLLQDDLRFDYPDEKIRNRFIRLREFLTLDFTEHCLLETPYPKMWRYRISLVNSNKVSKRFEQVEPLLPEQFRYLLYVVCEWAHCKPSAVYKNVVRIENSLLPKVSCLKFSSEPSGQLV